MTKRKKTDIKKNFTVVIYRTDHHTTVRKHDRQRLHDKELISFIFVNLPKLCVIYAENTYICRLNQPLE
jgi:hypothetical protein